MMCMASDDWWINSLVDLLFKKLFVTNLINLIALAMLGICFIYIVASSIWFYKTMSSRYTKDQEKTRDELSERIRLNDVHVGEKAALVSNKQDEIENWNKTIKQIESGESPASIRPSIQACIEKINLLTSEITACKKDILQCTKLTKKFEDEICAIQKAEIKHDVVVKAQSSHIAKANLAIKIAGIMLVTGTFFQYILYHEISLAYTQVAGIAFMVVYGISFNLKELTKKLEKVVLLGANQFDPKKYHPEQFQDPSSHQDPQDIQDHATIMNRKPLPVVKPLPSTRTAIANSLNLQPGSSVEKQIDDQIDKETKEIKEMRKKREGGSMPISPLPDDTMIIVNYPVIDEKTYLEVVSSTQKIFANLKMNGKRFAIMAVIHVLLAMLFAFDQYIRLIDVAIVFILAQFASLWIFKKYIRIDSFTGRFSNAFSLFLYKEFEWAFILHGDPVSSYEKFKIAKHLLQYLQFVLRLQLKARIENPSEVLQQIIAKYFDRSCVGQFSVFVSCLPERDAIQLLRYLPIHPSRSKYSMADIIKIIAGILSAVYGFMQIIKIFEAA